MDGSGSQSENAGVGEPAEIKSERERAKIAALNYVELSLANPRYGDARRDGLALAALAAPYRSATRPVTAPHLLAQ